MIRSSFRQRNRWPDSSISETSKETATEHGIWYVDAWFEQLDDELVLAKMSEEQYIASYPSNVWLSQLSFGGDQALKKSFQLNCAFCHQQASPFMRNERTEEQWISVIERMNTYGARLPEDEHEEV